MINEEIIIGITEDEEIIIEEVEEDVEIDDKSEQITFERHS